MGVLTWVVAPAIKDNFGGAGNVPMAKALLTLITAGLIGQFALVAFLVWREQHTFRWSRLKDAHLAAFAPKPSEWPHRRPGLASGDPVDDRLCSRALPRPTDRAR
jgi:hypothetical protein